MLPGATPLFRDFTEPAMRASLQRWYPADPFAMDWATRDGATGARALSEGHRLKLTDALLRQADGFDAGGAVLANIERLRNGAAAVVTGQQVALFGGPLLTLLKAATAVRKAQDATQATGREHVPVFWLASEDHDLAEVDQVALLTKDKPPSLATLRLGLQPATTLPVGPMVLGDRCDEGHDRLRAQVERASELLGWAPVSELLRECYAPGATLAGAFGRLISKLFAAQGLVVMDAGSREFHALGAPVLRAAIERADELEQLLLARSAELEREGYHAQVLVTPGHSLLFLVEESDDVMKPGARLPLRRVGSTWKAGARTYSAAELLELVDRTPERLSPNALLRPVFQDAILPTAAYVGGPAEVAYFAQSAVVYQALLGRVTPVLPRLSATLVEPAIAKTMAAHEVSFAQVLEARTAEALTLRLGARAMPIEGKRRLAAVGQTMEAELAALTEYMTAMSVELGRAAGVSASKMRYQMARLRRMAAAFEARKQESLAKHAAAIMLHLLPERHLQERVLAGVGFVASYGEGLPALLVEHAGQQCPGHRVIFL